MTAKAFWGFLCALAISCVMDAGLTRSAWAAQTVTVYSTRSSGADTRALEEFTKQTGIAVNLVTGKADELITRLGAESAEPKADVFIAVDGGVLEEARAKGLFQPVTAADVLSAVPKSLRARDDSWMGLTTRARVIVYASQRVKPADLSTYEALAEPKWLGRIVMRPGSALYNQSLVASLIELDGEKAVAAWVKGINANFARPPKGNDRDQAKDLSAGVGDVTVMNTYYLGRMLAGKDVAEAQAARSVGVFFPNQETTGTHINVCGMALVKGATHKAEAEKLMAWLVGVPAQEMLAAGNWEYPVNEQAAWPSPLKEWGTFKAQAIDFSALAKNKAKAAELLQSGGWE